MGLVRFFSQQSASCLPGIRERTKGMGNLIVCPTGWESDTPGSPPPDEDVGIVNEIGVAVVEARR